jgi:Tfp pilus assembly protein PilN
MSQVNLLPPEIQARQAIRRRTLMVIAAGAGVLGLVLAFYLLQVSILAGVNEEIAAQEATNASLQAQIDSLEKYQLLQEKAQAKEALLDSAYAYEVSFSAMLMDLSRVTPDDAYLNSFSAQVTAAIAEDAGAAPTGPFVGTLTSSGQALSMQTLAEWLTRLDSVKGWDNAWLTSITKADVTGTTGTGILTFSSGADLTQEALTARGKKAVEAP